MENGIPQTISELSQQIVSFQAESRKEISELGQQITEFRNEMGNRLDRVEDRLGRVEINLGTLNENFLSPSEINELDNTLVITKES